MNADELKSILRDHYIRPGAELAGVFFGETESPCGSRRADALYVPMTSGGGRQLIGHELKVSRSDLLVELANPTKCDPWLRFCNRWWLVVSDPAMIVGLEIPETWGVLAPPSGRLKRSMTVVKPAPVLAPIDQARAFHRLLTVTVRSHEDRAVNAERAVARLKEDNARLTERINNRDTIATYRNSEEAMRVAKIVKKVAEARRDEPWWLRVSDEQIAAVIIDYAAAQESAKRIRNELSRYLDDVGERTSALEEARKIFSVSEKLAAKALESLLVAEGVSP